jgi:cytochrome c-type protein NapC
MLAQNHPAAKALLFLLLFVVPAAATFATGWFHVEHSKKTEFCLSCHTMSEHGRSLFADDPSFLPASHYQNNRVPRDTACYTCHTDYTMYGDMASKWRGLRHVYVQYVTGPPKPETIRLYREYNNRECLYCHDGSRSFEEKSAHSRDGGMLTSIRQNKISCLKSGCHDVIHEVELLSDVKFWTPNHDE